MTLRFLTLFAVFSTMPLFAEDRDYGPPVAICLNKNTIPYINTRTAAVDIVNDAYKACAEIVDEWKNERVSLPERMIIKQDKALRDMYIRMVEIRRKADILKK